MTSLDPKSFTLAVNLLHPIGIEVATYKQISDALKKHYRPKVVIIYERFMFKSRYQKASLTFLLV